MLKEIILKSENKIKNIIISVLFIIWFIASILVLKHVAQNGQVKLVPIVFGQYFLVFGIIGLYSALAKGKFNFYKLPLLLFPIIGITSIVSGIIMQFGSKELITAFLHNLPYGILVGFSVIGLWLLMFWFKKTILLKRSCTYIINAKCIDVINQYSTNKSGVRKKVYCPVYEFYYNGNTYKVCNNVYTNFTIPIINNTYEIYINQNEPTQFYEPQRSKITGIALFILGISFVILPVVAMVMYSR